jgi:hypothetical protein
MGAQATSAIKFRFRKHFDADVRSFQHITLREDPAYIDLPSKRPMPRCEKRTPRPAASTSISVTGSAVMDV